MTFALFWQPWLLLLLLAPVLFVCSLSEAGLLSGNMKRIWHALLVSEFPPLLSMVLIIVAGILFLYDVFAFTEDELLFAVYPESLKALARKIEGQHRRYDKLQRLSEGLGVGTQATAGNGFRLEGEYLALVRESVEALRPAFERGGQKFADALSASQGEPAFDLTKPMRCEDSVPESGAEMENPYKRVNEFLRSLRKGFDVHIHMLGDSRHGAAQSGEQVDVIRAYPLLVSYRLIRGAMEAIDSVDTTLEKLAALVCQAAHGAEVSRAIKAAQRPGPPRTDVGCSLG